MRILLVDDDVDDQLLFLEVISSIDPEIICETAGNGEEALDKLRAPGPAPDLIFLDINMPRMGGRDCLQQIRTNRSLKHFPVIVISTYITTQDELYFRNHNADFMVKPNVYDKLFDEVRVRILRHKRGARATREE